MTTPTKIVWLAYASVALSFVWGIPGLILGIYAQRMAKRLLAQQQSLEPRARRDVKGGLLIARVGIGVSGFVTVVIIFKWISTLLM